MVPEERLAELLLAYAPKSLRDAGEALIAAANEAGGRDNITVLLLRVEELDTSLAPATEESSAARVSPQGGSAAGIAQALRERPTTTEGTRSDAEAPVVARRPRRPGPQRSGRRRRIRRAGAAAVAIAVLVVIGAGAYVALQSVYFIGTNGRGLVTVFRGVPYKLPGNIALYSSDYVSGVGASTLTPRRRHTLLDHSLRSEANAASLVRSLELGEVE
jgi:hypothetical protein